LVAALLICVCLESVEMVEYSAMIIVGVKHIVASKAATKAKARIENAVSIY
jgi:hypothetical protein